MCGMSYIHQMCLDEKWVREACPVSCQAQTEMCAPMQSYRLQRPVQPVLIVNPKPVAPTAITINPVTVTVTVNQENQAGKVLATEIKSDFTTNVDMSDLCKTTWQSICHLDFVQDACPESCPKNTVSKTVTVLN